MSTSPGRDDVVVDGKSRAQKSAFLCREHRKLILLVARASMEDVTEQAQQLVAQIRVTAPAGAAYSADSAGSTGGEGGAVSVVAAGLTSLVSDLVGLRSLLGSIYSNVELIAPPGFWKRQ